MAEINVRYWLDDRIHSGTIQPKLNLAFFFFHLICTFHNDNVEYLSVTDFSSLLIAHNKLLKMQSMFLLIKKSNLNHVHIS